MSEIQQRRPYAGHSPRFQETVRRYRRCLVIPDLAHDLQDAGFVDVPVSASLDTSEIEQELVSRAVARPPPRPWRQVCCCPRPGDGAVIGVAAVVT